MISKSQLEMIRLRNSKRNGELKRLKKAPKWLEPLTAERGYTASLYLYTFQIRKAITENLIPKIPKWLELSTLTYPDPVDPILDGQISGMCKKNIDSANLIKNDDIIDDVIAELNATLEFIDFLLIGPEQRAIDSAKLFGLEVAAFNNVQYKKSVDQVLAVDIFVEEPWLEPQLELFANQNAQLITNMTDNEINRVSGIVQRGLQEGSSLESITESIEKSFGITRRHAKLIARDQTSKLNGSLTKLRQQNLGVQTYKWLTAGDERVRQSHRVLDGRICRWDDPTVFLNVKTGEWVKRSTIGGTEVHTSQDVNCRCQPIAQFEDMFNGGNRRER